MNTPARRGDLVAVVTVDRMVVIGQPATTRTRVEVGTVTNITRDGAVRKYRPVWSDHPVDLSRSRHECLYVLAADRIDVPAALDVARAHCWPGHPDQPMPFESVDELRDALRPLVRAS